MRLLLATTVLCCGAACVGSRPSATTPAPPAAPVDTIALELRRATFDFVWGKIHETFWDSALLERKDWRGIGARYRPRALAAAGNVEYHRALNEMVRELALSHFAVVGPGALGDAWARARRATGDAGLRLRLIEGAPVVVRLEPGAAAHRAGIELGFVVDSIDGRPTLAAAVRTDGATAHAPAAAELPPSVALSLEGPLGSTLRLSVRDHGGARRSLRLALGPRRGRFHRLTLFGVPVPGIPPQYGEVEARTLPGGIAYVRFSTFLHPLRGDVTRAVRSARGASGLILDLRGNAGGQDGMGRRIAGLVVDRKSAFVTTRKRGRDETFHISPDAPVYGGPVVVLVDAGSGSASEQFAAGLQELGRAVVVGERTMGRDLDATVTRLRTGGMLQYAYGEVRTPNGVVLEGRGVVPDFAVALTRSALAAGRDSQLDAAVAVLSSRARARR